MGLRSKYRDQENAASDAPVPVAEEPKPIESNAAEMMVEPQPQAETKVEAEAEADTPSSLPAPPEPPEPPALKRRLSEMDQADAWQREQAQRMQAQRQAMEDLRSKPAPTSDHILAKSGLPPHAQDWLRKHPQFLTDRAANKALNNAHDIAVFRGDVELYSPQYFERLERQLGLRKPTNGNGRPAAAAPRPAPPPPPQRSAPAVPYSAPISRETVSMTTGQRQSASASAPLNADQQEIAAQIADSRGVSLEEGARLYREGLRRMRSEDR
jgi:hypothetical protein